MKPALAIIVLAILSSVEAQADTAILPDKPVPVVKVKTLDKEFIIDVAAVGAAWTMDTVSTHQYFVTVPRTHEVGGLFDGSRSTPKIMTAWAGIDAAVVIGSYEWKKHVHNKYLHPLWRAGLLFRTEAHTQAAFYNWHGISAYKK